MRQWLEESTFAAFKFAFGDPTTTWRDGLQVGQFGHEPVQYRWPVNGSTKHWATAMTDVQAANISESGNRVLNLMAQFRDWLSRFLN
jgi:hypothetical protein